MYDDLAALYDLFIDWPGRLASELPLLEAFGVGEPCQKILDVACGTGHHALAWAERGCSVRAFDASVEMVENAKALDLGNKVDWHVNTFANLPADAWGDALLCLGTSLPHVESLDGYRAALGAFAGALKPGGLLVIQNRNLPRTMTGGERERFLPPLARKRDEKNVVFWRFYDIMPPQHLNFHLVVLQEATAKWTHTVLTSRLCVVPAETLADAATEAGFVNVRLLGHLDGRPYEFTTSPDLVLVAEKG